MQQPREGWVRSVTLEQVLAGGGRGGEGCWVSGGGFQTTMIVGEGTVTLWLVAGA